MRRDFPDERFDAAYTALLLRRPSDPRQGVREMTGVFEPAVIGSQNLFQEEEEWM